MNPSSKQRKNESRNQEEENTKQEIYNCPTEPLHTFLLDPQEECPAMLEAQ